MTKSKAEEVFGHVLRRHRLEVNLSQEELAELSNLHRTYISQLERGLKSPSLKALLALAQALNTQAHILLREVEKELTPPG